MSTNLDATHSSGRAAEKPTRTRTRSDRVRTMDRTALVAVLVVVGALGWCTYDGVTYIPDCGNPRSRAKRDITGMTTGCQMYLDAWGTYPGEDLPLAAYLDGDVCNGGPISSYCSFRLDRMTPEGQYLDPWGRPYRYRVNAGEGRARVFHEDPERSVWNPNSVDIWSLGEDPDDPDALATNGPPPPPGFWEWPLR